jgi:hypothetical protein
MVYDFFTPKRAVNWLILSSTRAIGFSSRSCRRRQALSAGGRLNAPPSDHCWVERSARQKRLMVRASPELRLRWLAAQSHRRFPEDVIVQDCSRKDRPLIDGSFGLVDEGMLDSALRSDKA